MCLKHFNFFIIHVFRVHNLRDYYQYSSVPPQTTALRKKQKLKVTIECQKHIRNLIYDGQSTGLLSIKNRKYSEKTKCETLLIHYRTELSHGMPCIPKITPHRNTFICMPNV